jgi:LemA protein
MSVIVTVVIVLLVALWGIAVYNRLVRLRTRVQRDWRQVDLQLRRRHELIPNLVSAVKGAIPSEQGTLEAVLAARQRAMTATGPTIAAAHESQLSALVEQVITTVVERYPDLTVSQNVRSLQGDLAAIEEAIASARTAYNGTATAYNMAIGVVPNTIVAGLASFTRAELFATDAGGKAAPAVGLR